ncbi:Ribonuclease HII [hydrothermal vent metagenome]|uniref:Ribonuclease HII n=1 Tax=hydrothermal vent metagenome TaxID=652676 RepID=A0A3B0TSH4_9ZZZZ
MGGGKAKSRRRPDFHRETELIAAGARWVTGIDEAGRGPLAGPVVAAAVILDGAAIPAGIDDSKALSQGRREALFDQITSTANVGIGIAHVERIDRDNILQATLWAMGEAVAALDPPPCVALVDGNAAPSLGCDTVTLVGGDRLSVSIAAASIIAKVTRDRMMTELAQNFPRYGWERNKGYGTAAHLAALARHGPTPHHRRTFAPVREALTPR